MCLVVACSFALTCWISGEARANTGDAVEPVLQQFQHAVSETGDKYFAAKQKILAVEEAGDTVARFVAERQLGWRERMIASAIREQQKDRGGWEAVTKRLALLALFHRGRPHGAPRDFREMWDTNPRTLPAESEAKQLFEALAGKIGLAAEVILKHSPETIAEIAAATRLAAVKTLPEGSRMRVLIRNPELRRSDGNRLRLVTAEELLRRWPPEDRRWILLNARCLVGRALVLVGNEDGIRLLEEMGKEKVHQHDAVKYLEWIGTEAATQARERVERRWLGETAFRARQEERRIKKLRAELLKKREAELRTRRQAEGKQ